MKSLDKALDIVELIADRSGIGVREIAQRCGLPPATAHRIVAALTRRGYLDKNPRSHGYRLSPRFLVLGEKVQQQIDVVSVARPFLERLMADTRENANLCIRDGHKIVYVDQVGSPDHNLRIFTKLGGSAPLYASGVGKVFLSHFSESQLESYLKDVTRKRYTPHTLTTQKALVSSIQAIHDAGYAVDNQEKEVGVRCVAAPVYDHAGRIRAAVSVSGATQRLSMKRLPALGRRVAACARQISAALGHTAPP
jgi:IclR family acetate operon transcriptional repressor